MALATDRPGVHLRRNMAERGDLAQLVKVLGGRSLGRLALGPIGADLLGHRDNDGIVTHDPIPRSKASLNNSQVRNRLHPAFAPAAGSSGNHCETVLQKSDFVQKLLRRSDLRNFLMNPEVA